MYTNITKKFDIDIHSSTSGLFDIRCEATISKTNSTLIHVTITRRFNQEIFEFDLYKEELPTLSSILNATFDAVEDYEKKVDIR